MHRALHPMLREYPLTLISGGPCGEWVDHPKAHTLIGRTIFEYTRRKVSIANVQGW